MPHRLYREIMAALQPYETNHNTGVSYEIATLLWIARAAGLAEAEYGNVAAYVRKIAKKNRKGHKRILCALAAYAKSSRGCGVSIQGGSLAAIRNVTQNDRDGSTGDLVLITELGLEVSLSVFRGNPRILKKCLKNPTCRGFGCTDDDINTFKGIASDAVPRYEAEMRRTFGPKRSAWKRRKSAAAVDACAKVARLTAKRFNALTRSNRKGLYVKLLSLDKRGLPCDYLAIVDKSMRPHFFRVAPRANSTRLPDPHIVASGVFLHVSAAATQPYLAKVQVKFNNGVTSPIHSSWNAVVLLDQAFVVTPISLLKEP
jgi:hypothetical protein